MSSTYVLISPVKNEESLIKGSLESIVRQKKRPEQWVIVDDNSTDNTAHIIKEYCKKYDFIKYVKNDRSKQRDFAAKVNAMKFGYEALLTDDYGYLGIIDADITLEDNYYSDLINELEKDIRVGIAGGKIIDYVDGKKYPNPSSPYSIKGAIQLFRRKCFEQLGGFLPLKHGGEDAIACYMARKNGWQLKHYENLLVYHHRLNGTANENSLQTQYRAGRGEYHMGYLPIFSYGKCIKFLFQRPIIIGSLARLAGYFLASVRKEEIIVPADIIEFIRREQKSRIKTFQS